MLRVGTSAMSSGVKMQVVANGGGGRGGGFRRQSTRRYLPLLGSKAFAKQRQIMIGLKPGRQG